MIAILINEGENKHKEITKCVTNSMIPIEGEAIIKRILKSVYECNLITKFIIVKNSDSLEIEEYLGKYYNGIPICYCNNNKELNNHIKCNEKNNLTQSDIILLYINNYIENEEYKNIIKAFYNNERDVLISISNDIFKASKNNKSLSFVNKEEYIKSPAIVMKKSFVESKIEFISNIVSNNIKYLIDSINDERNIYFFKIEGEIYELNNIDSLLKLYNRSAEIPKHENIITLFKKTVYNRPNQLAVVCENDKLTYKELDELSENVAISLLNNINKKNAIIGVLVDKSVKFIVAILGVLKAGYTYVPMDTIYPEKRIDSMIKIANVEKVIVSKESSYFSEKKDICLSYEKLILTNNNLSIENYKFIEANSIAYIMFTSGSTGEPKGSIISHESIINNAYGLKKEIYNNYTDKCMNVGVFASIVFDMSVQQIYPSLIFGHTLNLIPNELKSNTKKVIEFLNKQDICDGTPTLLSIIISYLQQNCEVEMTIKHLIIGGEVLPYRNVKQYFEYNPRGIITNIYGPTECTVEVTTFTVDKNNIEDISEIYIGKPMINTRVYLLDDNKKMVEPGKEGEIYIAGLGVGKGYINNEEISKECFLKDILCREKLMYKTGDIAYWNENGQLSFLRRKDSQVKFHGYRIELEEIETVLENIEYITKAKVLIQKEKSNSKKIVAYISVNISSPDLLDIIDRIKLVLPSYMIPSYFVPIKEFPITINGKLDIKSLPSFEEHALRKKDTYNAIYSLSKVEKEFLDIVKSVLNINYVLIMDSFISLGGDSLEFFRLLIEIEKKFNININTKHIDMYMSFKKIVEIISKKKEIVKENKKSGVRVLSRKLNCLPMQNYLIKQEIDAKRVDNKVKLNDMVYFVKIEEDIDINKLEDSFNYVLENNDAFHMAFHLNDIRSKAFYKKFERQKIKVINKEIKDFEEWTNDFENFNLNNTPLIQGILYITKEELYFGISVHHCIFDYLSFHFFMQEIELYYFSGCYHKKDEASFFNYLNIYNRYMRSDDKYKIESFWQNYKKRMNPVYLNNSKSNITFKHEKLNFYILENDINRIIKFCRINKLTEYYFFITCFLLTIEKYTKDKYLTLTTFLSGRNNSFNIESIGFYSTVMMYNYKRSTNENFFELASKIKNELKVLEDNHIGFDIEKIQDDNSSKSTILFDYLKLYNFSGVDNKLWKVAYPYEGILHGIPLDLHIYDYGKEYRICFLFDVLTYSKEFIEKFYNSFKKTIFDIINSYT